MPESKLTVITTTRNEKRVMITVKTKKGKEISQPVGLSLSSDLAAIFKANPDELNNYEVEYECEKGKPISKIWKKGGKLQASTAQQQPRATAAHHNNQNRNAGNHQQRGDRNPPRQPEPPAFHNPYNFVPSLPRDKINNNLGDYEPLGHHAYHDEHYSGWIEVELTTGTPLLIPDAAQVSTNQNDHKIFPVRVDANGVPYLPPTSIKGMLRSAYETVTNSRFGVFEKHEDRLAYRMEARKGVEMVPAVVEAGTSGLKLRLLNNKISMKNNGEPEDKTMYAAWLYYYRNPSLNITSYPDGSSIQHGDKVWVRCDKKEHSKPYFKYQSVITIEPRQNGEKHRNGYQAGIVSITNQNINKKHDERVFLLTDNDPQLELSDGFIKAWKTLVKNYQDIHIDDLKKRNQDRHEPNEYLGNQPGKTGWSRHIYTKEAVNLKAGDICYAQIERKNTGYNLLGLYPVMISRDLFDEAPKDLLPDSLHSATDYEKLSPADRVFGWVNQDKNGEGSWKGQLRIGTAKCEQGKNAIEKFGDDGVPLAILGEAKPQQTHFYVADDKEGKPLNSRNKADGYKKRTQGLRGRKVYPHHAHLAGINEYWLQPRENNTQIAIPDKKSKNYHKEYQRPDNIRDNQNRSILGWIKPDIKFHFKIHVSNLSSVELGALLWLLNLDHNYYHRLGSAKPLGFGSVNLKIKDMELQTGQDWAAYYENLSESAIAPFSAETHIQAYQKAVKEAYKNSFEQVSFIKAFKVALRGFKGNLPTHYPRQDEKPNPQGESFKWFTENERTHHLALPSLEDEKGLPLLKMEQKK